MRWKTQALHSICYPSQPPEDLSYTLSHIASPSTHSLPLPSYLTTPSPPSPLPLPPLSPPPLAYSSLAPAPASVAVSASDTLETSRLNPEPFTSSLLRPRSTSRSRSRLRAHSSSGIADSQLLAASANSDFAPSTVAMTERPAIYVHFEFGVSWTPRHAPKNRQVTYMSRSMRDRANQFPRQLPPLNTNFLTSHPTQSEPPSQPYQQQPLLLQQQQQPYVERNVAVPNSQQPPFQREVIAVPPPQPITSYPPGQHQSQPQAQWEALNPQRTSRSQSRSSHERGRSAPPPFNNSPWDADPGSSSNNTTSNNLPRDQRSRAPPEVWKALPTTPNHFRLGEDGMPWSSWTFPMGYADEDNIENEDNRESRRESDSMRNLDLSFMPQNRSEASDREKGKAQEMQSLAAALVTVDNGFEDQWWYQGPRLVHVAGNVLQHTQASQSQNTQDIINSAPEWEVPNQDIEPEQHRNIRDVEEPAHSWASFQAMTPRSSVVDIVSPISDFSSPMPGYNGLHRSLTTRSDELHM